MKKKQVTTQKHYSPRAVLVAIGTKIRALNLLQPIEDLVKIRQKLREYGFLRLVRDAFQVSGLVEMDARGKVIKIVLNQRAAWAKKCISALSALLKPEQVAVILGET